MKKTLWKLFLILSGIYVLLFIVFFFDLDGKFLYYVWEPMAVRRYDSMKHKDLTQTPYEAKEKA